MDIFVKELSRNIFPVFAGGENCESGHTFGPAVRTHYILHYIVSGQGEFSVDGKTYKLKEGQAFLIKPGEVTVYKADRKNP